MPEQTTQNTRVASNARDPSARHSGVHLTGRETGTRLTECAPILKGGHPNKAPASPLGSILIPGSQARKAGCTHGSVGGRGVITGLPLSHSGKPVHLSPSLSLLCNQQVETTRPCPRPKGTPFRPRVNLAGPEGPGPASLSLAGACHWLFRQRSEAALLSRGGKGRGSGTRARFLCAPKNRHSLLSPPPPTHSRAILYLRLQPLQPRTPTHVTTPPAPASRTRSIYHGWPRFRFPPFTQFSPGRSTPLRHALI